MMIFAVQASGIFAYQVPRLLSTHDGVQDHQQLSHGRYESHFSRFALFALELIKRTHDWIVPNDRQRSHV